MYSLLSQIFLGFLAVSTYGMTLHRVEVNEGDDVILPCSADPKVNLEPTVIHWKTPDENGQEVYFYSNGEDSVKGLDGQDKQFENRVTHFQDELKNGNASIKITKTTVDDNGNYTCSLPLLQPRQTYRLQLVVRAILKDRTGEDPRASPKPRTKVVSQTEDWALLRCEIQRASPKPSLEFQDSFGNILHANKSTVETHVVTVQATVNKTGTYRCVLRQKELHHEIYDDIYVFMPKTEGRRQAEGSSTEAIIGLVFGGWIFGAVTVVVSLLLALRFSPRLHHKVISALSKLQPRCDKTPQENGDLNKSMMDHRSSQQEFY